MEREFQEAFDAQVFDQENDDDDLIDPDLLVVGKEIERNLSLWSGNDVIILFKYFLMLQILLLFHVCTTLVPWSCTGPRNMADTSRQVR